MKEKYLLIPSNYSIKPYFVEADPSRLQSDFANYLGCRDLDLAYCKYDGGVLLFLYDMFIEQDGSKFRLNQLATMLYGDVKEPIYGPVIVAWSDEFPVLLLESALTIRPLPHEVMNKLCDICGILPPKEE